MWMYSKDGNYSVKSGYFAIKKWKQDKCPEPSSTEQSEPIRKKLWAIKTVPIHQILLWRILKGLFLAELS
jgi:hypothetical protein